MYLSSSLLEKFKGLPNQIAQIASFALVVFNFVANVGVAVSEDVEDGQNLTIVRYQCLANHVSRKHQLLNHFQHGCNNVRITGIQRS